MKPFVFFQIVALSALTACAAPQGISGAGGNTQNLPGAGGAADAPKGSLGGVELCDAETFRPLIGQPYTSVTAPTGPRLRVYSNVAVVTQEYMPNRTNVVYNDRTGLILRAFCG